MAACFYFEETIQPIKEGSGGKPDESKEPVTFEILRYDLSDDKKVFLRTTDSEGNYTTFPLTKKQVRDLYEAVGNVGLYWKYLNEKEIS